MTLTADAWYLLREPECFNPGPGRAFGKKRYLSLNAALLTGEQEPPPDPGAYFRIQALIRAFRRRAEDTPEVPAGQSEAQRLAREYEIRMVAARVEIYRVEHRGAWSQMDCEKRVADDLGMSLKDVGDAVYEARWLSGE